MTGEPVRLTLIGYWLGESAPGWPDVHDFVDRDWDRKQRKPVVRWLESGVVVRAYMGWSQCRFCGKVNGYSDCSDGVYIWPEGLAHYLKKHHVRLPEQVVKWATEPRPPFLSTVRFNYEESGVTRSIDVPIGHTAMMIVESDWWRGQRPTIG